MASKTKYEVSQVIEARRANTPRIDNAARPRSKERNEFLIRDRSKNPTLTLVKVGRFKGNTQMREERMTLTKITAHKIQTPRKIKATIILKDQEIKHVQCM